MDEESAENVKECRNAFRGGFQNLDQQFHPNEIIQAALVEVYAYALFVTGGNFEVVNKMMRGGMRDLKAQQSEVLRSLEGATLH